MATRYKFKISGLHLKNFYHFEEKIDFEICHILKNHSEYFFVRVNKNFLIVKIQEVVSLGHRFGSAPLFGFGVGTDLKDSDSHILSFEQDGLSFMNRDYYLNVTDGEPLGKGLFIPKIVSSK